MAKKGKGRPKKIPEEKMHFGVICTESEAETVRDSIRKESYKKKKRITVSEYILRKIGIR